MCKVEVLSRYFIHFLQSRLQKLHATHDSRITGKMCTPLTPGTGSSTQYGDHSSSRSQLGSSDLGPGYGEAGLLSGCEGVDMGTVRYRPGRP